MSSARKAAYARMYGRNKSTKGMSKAMLSLQRAREKHLRAARRAAVVPGVTRTGGVWNRFGNEEKWLDTALTGTIDLTGEIPAAGGQICLIPQGDGPSARDGNKCVVTSVYGRFDFQIFTQVAANLTNTNVWIYLVLDTQANGAAAAVTDVFTSANLWECFRNLNNSERFKILKKKKIEFNPAIAGVTGSVLNGPMAKHVEIYKKCNIPLVFSSSTGALSEIRSNNIFWIWGTDNDDDIVNSYSYTRIRFRG